MMRLMALATFFCLFLGTQGGRSYADTKSGAVKFTPGGKESVNVTLGDKLKLDATYRLIDVGGISAISVSGSVKNTTSSKLNYAYFVAFLDRDKNLVGCQQFTLFVLPDKQQTAGTFIQLPAEQISRIASYSAAFYESEQAIGKR